MLSLLPWYEITVGSCSCNDIDFHFNCWGGKTLKTNLKIYCLNNICDIFCKFYHFCIHTYYFYYYEKRFLIKWWKKCIIENNHLLIFLHFSVTTVDICDDSSLLAFGTVDSIVRVQSITPSKIRTMKNVDHLNDIDKDAGKILFDFYLFSWYEVQLCKGYMILVVVHVFNFELYISLNYNILSYFV